MIVVSAWDVPLKGNEELTVPSAPMKFHGPDVAFAAATLNVTVPAPKVPSQTILAIPTPPERCVSKIEDVRYPPVLDPVKVLATLYAIVELALEN